MEGPVPVRPVVAVVVVRPLSIRPVARPVIVVRCLSVHPVVRLIVTYITSRSIRRMRKASSVKGASAGAKR